jgi:hypothetical protein
MNNLVDLAALGPILEDHGVDYSGEGFEELYSRLYRAAKSPRLLAKLESAICSYFSNMELPDRPTLYDHLVLSLREKDAIATFNWDPFLWQACTRNERCAGLPHTLFLHGNVAVGYCLRDRKKGPVGGLCSVCRRPFERSPLLWPIEQKDYASDPYIASEWETLRRCLKDAYLLTIFGYGAPSSDLEAIRLMKEGWGHPSQRALEEVEIIDVVPEEELRRRWEPFIHTHHYRTWRSYYDSTAASYPRRSCEAIWSMLMENEIPESTPLPSDAGFEGLVRFVDRLTKHEGR